MFIVVFQPVLSNVFRTHQYGADSYSQAQAKGAKRMSVDFFGHYGKNKDLTKPYSVISVQRCQFKWL